MWWRRRLFCASVSFLAFGINLSGQVRAGEPGVGLAYVATVQRPTFVTHAPGDFDRIFVAEQDGRVTIIDSGVVLPTPFLDITELVYSEGIYPGLLGLAFHPQYQTNGFFYVVYHDQPDQNITMARYEVSVDPDIADQSSAHPVLSIPCGPNNNCVWIGFGPNDGYLYLASGDGGLSSNAQDLDTLLGKILRLDVDDDDFPEDPNRNYSYPPDNPFVGTAGADETWAYGFRKPWRCSFDRETGDLYIGEVGTSLWEEVNFQPADSFGGENYGYGCMEGEQCTNDPSCDCLDPSLANPIFVYENIGGAAVIGGYVYRGCAISGLVGAYVVADYLANQIWQFRYDGQDLTDLQEIQDYLVPCSRKGVFVKRTTLFVRRGCLR